MNDNKITDNLIHQTAQIPWHELQRFFASGNAISVDSSLDLIEVASHIATDNAPKIKMWMEAGLVGQVKDAQAKEWFDTNTLVWALVVKPWVLVQQKQAITS
jgi:hypothetical protein